MEALEKFTALGLSENMLKALKKKGFEAPTPIQEKIIPIALNSEKDLIGQAQTGTGKTAAFGIPIIERIAEKAKHVQVLILTPTRELAIQVAEEFSSLKGKKKIRVMPIYGGQSIQLQFKHLKKGADVVVGTPGRVLDHLQRRTLDLNAIEYVVLDEADEMLNMGFIEDVKMILSLTNPGRKTMLFSATMPHAIVDVSKQYMKAYDLVKIDKKHTPVELTDQIYFEVAKRDKFEALCRIIDIETEFYGIVFCRTKVDVDQITAHLTDRGYDAEALHGDISQPQREKILAKFRKRRVNILVATDVAARGIDINDLTHVINYAIPQDPEAYIHRIGRTGRAGKEGTAITFITPEEYRKLMYIKRAAKTDIRREKLPKVHEIINTKRDRIKSDIGEISQSEEVSENFLEMARELLTENDAEKTIAALLQYTFQDELNPANYNDIRDGHPKIGGKTRLFIAAGKKDRMTKRRLVEFIKTRSNVPDRKIDNVQVLDNYSFITVPLPQAEIILKAFRKQNRGKRKFIEIANEKQKNGRRK